MPEDFEDEEWGEDRPPSKSQRKRDMEALRGLGRRLTTISDEMLSRISDPELIAAVRAAKKITKGSARKRQVQYIGKLLRSGPVDEVQDLIDRLDASSHAHATRFHQLEQWRERLITEDPDALDELIEAFPDVDRQHLRQLVRAAVSERAAGREPPVHYRKLFQYLRALSDGVG